MGGIHDVARAAGVSVSTVSRVLNQMGGVAPDKVERVMAAAEQLGYRPNVLARSLVTRRTKTLGLVIPDIGNPTFPAVARGAEDEAYRQGFTLILCNSDGEPAKESRYVEDLIQKQVDGVLITSAIPDAPHIRELAARVPVVQVGRRIDAGLPAVIADNRTGGALAARHLLGLGHRRIAFIGGPAGEPTGHERLRAFLEELAGAGVEQTPELVLHATYDFQGGHRAAVEILRRSTNHTAIVGGNDLIAMGAMEALKEAGRRVPQEVSVIGFDNIPAAELCSPALTTVGLRYQRMGAVAASVLIDLIHGRKRPANITLGVELVVRSSTAPASGVIQ